VFGVIVAATIAWAAAQAKIWQESEVREEDRICRAEVIRDEAEVRTCTIVQAYTTLRCRLTRDAPSFHRDDIEAFADEAVPAHEAGVKFLERAWSSTDKAPVAVRRSLIQLLDAYETAVAALKANLNYVEKAEKLSGKAFEVDVKYLAEDGLTTDLDNIRENVRNDDLRKRIQKWIKETEAEVIATDDRIWSDKKWAPHATTSEIRVRPIHGAKAKSKDETPAPS
jgi:hypothetical protein